MVGGTPPYECGRTSPVPPPAAAPLSSRPMKCSRALVLLNKRSGTLAFSDRKDERERIVSGLRAHGIHAEVHFIDPGKIDRVIAAGRSGGCTAVLVGGGD